MPSTPARIVRIGPHEVANDRPFLLIAGPCQIESRDHAMEMADAIRMHFRLLALLAAQQFRMPFVQTIDTIYSDATLA